MNEEKSTEEQRKVDKERSNRKLVWYVPVLTYRYKKQKYMWHICIYRTHTMRVELQDARGKSCMEFRFSLYLRRFDFPPQSIYMYFSDARLSALRPMPDASNVLYDCLCQRGSVLVLKSLG